MNDYDKISEGFDIFRQFLDENDRDVSVDHDVIYAGPPPSIVPGHIQEKLEKLGWHPCNEHNCFYKFV